MNRVISGLSRNDTIFFMSYFSDNCLYFYFLFFIFAKNY